LVKQHIKLKINQKENQVTDLNELKSMQENAVCLHTIEEIETAINKVAKEMNEQLVGKNPLFLCVMNGAVIFMGHLVTRLNFPLQMDYVHASRYQGEMNGGKLCWFSKPSVPLKGRTVILVEDILDTGATLASIKQYCHEQEAEAVYMAALIDKDHPRVEGGVEKCDFTGLYVEDKFLIGYGLDYQGYFRNLPGIFAVNSD
jgi:hypoxanthine phosphoribosyltransferase